MRLQPAVGIVAMIVSVTAASACSGGDASEGRSASTPTDASVATSTTSTASTIASTTIPDTTSTSTTASTSTTTTTTTTTTSSSTTSTTSTTTIAAVPIPIPPGPLDLNADVVALGASVEGRPIVAERYGTPGGRRVLVIGVIHGDEQAGVDIVSELRASTVPDGAELWLVESMNPDGLAANDRQNGNQVDLNRNFPYDWGPIGVPGDGQYAGTGPASEPETQAITNFISQLRPDITIWYHQDLFVISPAQGREGLIRARYAELTGLPIGGISGGTYTGIAATWARNELRPDDGVAFIVELGPTLSPDEAITHAQAVLTIATEP